MTNTPTPEDDAPKPDPQDGAPVEPASADSSRDESPVDEELEPSVRDQLRDLHLLVASQHNADVHGLTQMLGSKRHLFFVNFMTGVSRGVGFFLGATLIGALIIGGGAYLLDASAEAVGLKDVTTRSIVGSMYSKFHEIKSVIDDLEQETEKLGSPEEAAKKVIEDAEKAAEEATEDDGN